MKQHTFIAKATLPALLIAIGLAGCADRGASDAYGNFESTEVVVSSETPGRILELNVEEGEQLKAGAVTALVDTTQLHFSLMQLEAERKALAARMPTIVAESAVYRQKLKNLDHDVERYTRLVADGAAPAKQLEDIQNEVKVVRRQIRSVNSKNPEITQQLASMDARIGQLRDQISRSTVKSPIDGTVLAKYAEPGELVPYGKPLYRIADLDTMYLRAYVGAGQLSSLRIGQKVEVLFDGRKPAEKSLEGTLTWISSKAEFTPKIIQTREDRINMVYAVKILVDNSDGLLKIGMPGEIRLKGR
ncbi:HlyD family efflux transporter periplasmic adaptor subunit [Chlorobium sp. N1]|uniref:HlyD family secretion protein n=1 Tax=Chlorobium sp. N1 TaxID=2491138 RepID=UPI00103D98DA|nr:HlyD family efflux transporter periplasmic adaptor subunit [Chlorobium sp. N1]TCD47417.1 HlyD family efflux transporter periplasmic adaptor subunit [Chlorobium sp. N1]